MFKHLKFGLWLMKYLAVGEIKYCKLNADALCTMLMPDALCLCVFSDTAAYYRKLYSKLLCALSQSK